MGVRKQSEQNIRKLTKLGGKSLAVTLPVELVEKLKWKEKQRVVVKRKGSKLIISDFKVKKKK
ncbi:MAG: AbrB/MazE/SpoVT family DNA-binding domain-containing protein [Candidatus Doudnabacteria bacterium]|jgi:antitoxin component of MazEF toxin-antitoxin module